MIEKSGRCTCGVPRSFPAIPCGVMSSEPEASLMSMPAVAVPIVRSTPVRPMRTTFVPAFVVVCSNVNSSTASLCPTTSMLAPVTRTRRVRAPMVVSPKT